MGFFENIDGADIPDPNGPCQSKFQGTDFANPGPEAGKSASRRGVRGRKIVQRKYEILLKFGTAEPIFDPELGKFMQIERNNLRNVKPVCKAENIGSTPEIRADVVARGKALIADPNYPSRQQIGKIATLLAAKWDGGLPLAEAPRRDNTLHVAAV